MRNKISWREVINLLSDVIYAMEFSHWAGQYQTEWQIDVTEFWNLFTTRQPRI